MCAEEWQVSEKPEIDSDCGVCSGDDSDDDDDDDDHGDDDDGGGVGGAGGGDGDISPQDERYVIKSGESEINDWSASAR